MALIACPDCGQHISTSAPACPRCGRAMHLNVGGKFLDPMANLRSLIGCGALLFILALGAVVVVFFRIV